MARKDYNLSELQARIPAEVNSPLGPLSVTLLHDCGRVYWAAYRGDDRIEWGYIPPTHKAVKELIAGLGAPMIAEDCYMVRYRHDDGCSSCQTGAESLLKTIAYFAGLGHEIVGVTRLYFNGLLSEDRPAIAGLG